MFKNIINLSPLCGGVAAGAVYDCDDPLVPGTNPDITIFNLKDVETVTYNVGNPRLIEGITLSSGNQAYLFEGIRQSTTAQTELVQQTLSTGYNHSVAFSVFDVSSTQKANLEKMALSKIVIVVENRNALGNADSVFEVYGLGVGLEITTLTRINNDVETGAAYTIEARTSDNEGKEVTLPLSWWLTDYATTKALVTGLLTPAP